MLALFPELAASIQEKDLEKLSVLVRRYFAGDDAAKPRLDALAVVRQFGIPVGMAPIKYLGAIAVKDDDGDIRASIIVRDNLAAEQLNFLLSHLLGHFLLQIQPRLAKSEWKSSGFKEMTDPSRRYAAGEGLAGLSARDYANEDLADRFAAALLMPSAMLNRAMEKIGDIAKVAEVFGVSTEMVERRMEDLGTMKAGLENARVGARVGARVATPIDVLNQLADSDSQPREVPPEQLIRDVSQPVASMPRAVAAHSYSDAAHIESSAAASEENSDEPKVLKKNASGGLKGMDRIRELARRMDKFGDKS